ncbi:hypothetical protein FNV43_RR06081 [Rhamnella rubrinervis]|uniref:Uncharacterized protein n=1 Tax=Rhamnella rubrinervis TaxID=2594499 RepID=A0A8K0HCC0_9ROSA|nr:hypothetical protein FNV43_RR06081 [Rhamnella rubrinervis]
MMAEQFPRLECGKRRRFQRKVCSVVNLWILSIFHLPQEEKALWLALNRGGRVSSLIDGQGVTDVDNSTTLKDALNDSLRIEYHHEHLSHVLKAIVN